MSDTAYLALLLDAPLQSWGFASRFQRRTTGLHPTKSGVIGLICAAMGLAKGSAEEQTTLPELAKLKMTSIAIPRVVQPAGLQPRVLRLEDYQTVLNTRRASGSPNKDAVVTRRQYLLDARFGVILFGSRTLLDRVEVGTPESGVGSLARSEELHPSRTALSRFVRLRAGSTPRTAAGKASRSVQYGCGSGKLCRRNGLDRRSTSKLWRCWQHRP